MERNSRALIQRLEREGWVLRNTSGSHHQYKNPITGALVTVPHPKKDLPTGTVRSIYKQAGWSLKGTHT